MCVVTATTASGSIPVSKKASAIRARRSGMSRSLTRVLSLILLVLRCGMLVLNWPSFTILYYIVGVTGTA